MTFSKSDIAYCPHCGNTTPQSFVGEAQNRDHFKYVTTQCQTCLHALLYFRRLEYVDPERNERLSKFTLRWPAAEALHPAVPVSVAQHYNEASKIKVLAPNAFASSIRRALEALCKDRGATKKTLALNLQYLADQGEIPATLSEMTDILRALGNIGSHAGEESILPEHVDVIDEFFRAVIEYVYIGPFKVREFKASLQQMKNHTTPIKSNTEEDDPF